MPLSRKDYNALAYGLNEQWDSEAEGIQDFIDGWAVGFKDAVAVFAAYFAATHSEFDRARFESAIYGQKG